MTERRARRRYDETPTAARAAAARAVAPTVDALPGLARVAAVAGWHTTEWGVRTIASVAPGGPRGHRPATRPRARPRRRPGAVGGRRARPLGVGRRAGGHGADVGRRGARRARRAAAARPWWTGTAPATRPTLRERGAELLERSRDVWNTDGGPPGLRADPRRARPRRGPDPGAAAEPGSAAQRRRPDRRAGRAW